MPNVTRRSWLQTTLAAVASGAAAAQEPARSKESLAHANHAMGTVGRVSTAIFDPSVFARSWNFSHLPEPERAKFYRETPRPGGTLFREYEFYSVDREIEIAPGVFFPAWTYNGQVPGPTIRVNEGDRVKVTFTNQSVHPHSMHFHGWHPPAMDGALPDQQA